MGGDERAGDEALLNCILDMKPMAQKQRQQQQPMARRNNQYYNNGDNYDNLKAVQQQQIQQRQLDQRQLLLQQQKQQQVKSRVTNSSLPTSNQVFPRQRTSNVRPVSLGPLFLFLIYGGRQQNDNGSLILHWYCPCYV